MADLLPLLLLVLGAIAGALTWPSLYAKSLRDMFRAWPEARDDFVGRGAWISFSRRFGKPYALGAFALAFAWIIVGAQGVPNTTAGVWILFGPAIALIVVGVVLAALVVCRWVVDE